MAANDGRESSSSEIDDDQTIPGLREALDSCSMAMESGSLSKLDQEIEELVVYLDSVAQLVLSDPDNEDSKSKALEVIVEIEGYMCSFVDQAGIDALALCLPGAIAKFASVSDVCLQAADRIIDKLMDTCGARDILTSLCAALAPLGEPVQPPSYFPLLLSGISRAFLSIKKNQYKHVKEALRAILNPLNTISREPNVEEVDLVPLFQSTLLVANSVQRILEETMQEKLRALLSLFILQIMTLVSVSMGHRTSCCLSLVIQLTSLLRYCGLSYLGCITKSDVENMSSILFEEDEDVNEMSCFSQINHGACLAVIWGRISDEVSQSAAENVTDVSNKLRRDQDKRWQAVAMLKHIFESIELPWEFKRHGIEFLLEVTEDSGASSKSCGVQSQVPDDIVSFYATLQAVQIVMMFAPDADLRKNAFEALKRVLADIPPLQRFDVLKALIKNSISSSMTAILINLLRGEMLKEQKSVQGGTSHNQGETFWNADILKVVEQVLRPNGGAPALEDSDAVQSALNLYRYTLLTECAGKSNKTGVFSKDNLQKAYKDWLLPLRTLLVGFLSMNDDFRNDNCMLNPVEFVLHLCIELVEEQLK